MIDMNEFDRLSGFILERFNADSRNSLARLPYWT
jgi:hypothetical protein